jgi:hypothetical protein
MKICSSCKTKSACKKAGKCLGRVKADKKSREGLAGKMTEGSY